MKKWICFLISAIMMFSCSICAFADVETPVDEDPTEPYSYTASITSTLSISTNKTATCYSKVIGIAGLATRITITWSTLYNGCSFIRH